MLINLVIDSKEIEKRCAGNEFERADLSRTWLNTLEKEMGRSRFLDVSGDPGEIFSGTSVVIISSSVQDPPGKFMERAVEFASSGGVLVIEMPSGRWNHVLERDFIPDGVEILKINTESGLKRISPRILPFPFIDYLEDMPLMTRLINIEDVPDDMEVLLDIGEKPGFVQFEYGKGWVLFFMFDFAMQVTTLRQGISREPGYGVRERFGKVPFVIETEDLALDKKMLDNPVPYADLLEKFFMAALEDLTFFPRLWYFPYGYDGVFMMSHDDEKRGRKESMYMVEEESKRGYVSTFFVTCPPGADCRWEKAEEDILKKGFDIQWHWNRFPDNIKIYSPEEQVENFSKIGGVKLTSCRLHFLNWGNHYTEPFRVMEKMGVKLDSSYGPNKGKGYVFGTGMPFHPMDTDGNLFSLWEIPFQTQEDWGGADQEYFDSLLKNSAGLWHSVIVPLFHPHKVAKKEGRTLWLNSFHRAEENNHWITTFSGFGDFYGKRCGVEMGIGSGDIYIPVEKLLSAGNIEYIPGIHQEGYYIRNVSGDITDKIALRIPLEKEWVESEEGKEKKEAANARVIKDAGRHYLLLGLKYFWDSGGEKEGENNHRGAEDTEKGKN